MEDERLCLADCFVGNACLPRFDLQRHDTPLNADYWIFIFFGILPSHLEIMDVRGQRRRSV